MSGRTGVSGGAGVSGRTGVSRRAMLRAGVLAGAGSVVVGCANSGSSDPTSSGTGSSDTGSSGTEVIALDDVPVGGVAAVTIDRVPAFVARPDPSTVRAFSAVCTHRGCTVLAQNDLLMCPCHGSHFALLTGAVLRGPAQRPLPPIDVHVSGGEVLSGRGAAAPGTFDTPAPGTGAPASGTASR